MLKKTNEYRGKEKPTNENPNQQIQNKKGRGNHKDPQRTTHNPKNPQPKPPLPGQIFSWQIRALLLSRVEFKSKHAWLEAVDFHVLPSVVSEAVMVTRRSSALPAAAEGPERLSHRQVAAAPPGSLGDLGRFCSQRLFSVQSSWPARTLQPSCLCGPDFIWLGKTLVHFSAAGDLCTGRGGVCPGRERTWLWG